MQFTEILWLAAIIIFGVLEAVTFQLVSVWFAGGALGALIASLAGASTALQAVTFVSVSALLLIFTHPLVKKLTKGKVQKTNADSLIGKEITVTKVSGVSGEARAGGTVWTVMSSGGIPLSEGDTVTVEKIEGVKLIVKK